MGFGGINIALSALYAQRQAMDTTGHNIANANTEGYTRQRVSLPPLVSVDHPHGVPLDEPHGLARGIIGQTQDHEIGGVQHVASGGSIPAFRRIDRDELDIPPFLR